MLSPYCLMLMVDVTIRKNIHCHAGCKVSTRCMWKRLSKWRCYTCQGYSDGPVNPPPDEQPPLRTTSRLWSGPQWSDCRGARCLRTLSKVIDRPSDGEVLALHLGIAEPCLQMFMIALRTWCYTRPGADASSSPIDVSQRAVLFIYNCPLGRRRRAKPRSTPFLSRLLITVYY